LHIFAYKCNIPKNYNAYHPQQDDVRAVVDQFWWQAAMPARPSHFSISSAARQQFSGCKQGKA
jgi:hypothetical protein